MLAAEQVNGRQAGSRERNRSPYHDLSRERSCKMKAYANPAAGASSAPLPLPVTTTTPLQRIAVGAAARLGAIAAGLLWLFAGLSAFVFDLFGVNLWLTVLNARWVPSAGWDSLPVFMAQFGGLITGVAGAILLGGLLGSLTAWVYNFTVPSPEEYVD
jgi:hypothetical protein